MITSFRSTNWDELATCFNLVFLSEKGIKSVCIDASTLPRERKEAVDSFGLIKSVKL